MSGSASSLMLMVRLALSLGLVLAMVGAAVWALRRRGTVRDDGRPRDRLEVVERRPLTKGAHVALVRLGEERFLVGVTERRVELLGRAGPEPTREPSEDDVLVELALLEQTPALPGPSEPRPRAVATTSSGGAEAGATRRTGIATPVRGAGQESRMGFVEALRELTVRRS